MEPSCSFGLHHEIRNVFLKSFFLQRDQSNMSKDVQERKAEEGLAVAKPESLLMSESSWAQCKLLQLIFGDKSGFCSGKDREICARQEPKIHQLILKSGKKWQDISRLETCAEWCVFVDIFWDFIIPPEIPVLTSSPHASRTRNLPLSPHLTSKHCFSTVYKRKKRFKSWLLYWAVFSLFCHFCLYSFSFFFSFLSFFLFVHSFNFEFYSFHFLSLICGSCWCACSDRLYMWIIRHGSVKDTDAGSGLDRSARWKWCAE